jgi:hypothetical protein
MVIVDNNANFGILTHFFLLHNPLYYNLHHSYVSVTTLFQQPR